MISVTIPLKVESLNVLLTMHWAKRSKYADKHRVASAFHLKHFGQRTPPALPLKVTLTRIAPRKLDAHDNLTGGFKNCVDGVADYLGIADNDPGVTFHYQQETGKPLEYGLRIELQPTGDTA